MKSLGRFAVITIFVLIIFNVKTDTLKDLSYQTTNLPAESNSTKELLMAANLYPKISPNIVTTAKELNITNYDADYFHNDQKSSLNNTYFKHSISEILNAIAQLYNTEYLYELKNKIYIDLYRYDSFSGIFVTIDYGDVGWPFRYIYYFDNGVATQLNIDNSECPNGRQEIYLRKLKGSNMLILNEYHYTHMGNGSSGIYIINSNLNIDYSGVGYSYQSYHRNVLDSINSIEFTQGYNKVDFKSVLEFYEGGTYKPAYRDVNKDGFDDIIMNGVLVYEFYGKNKKNNFVIKIKLSDLYLYDPKKCKFFKSKTNKEVLKPEKIIFK